MVRQEIAVASFSQVYDLDRVETALNDLSEGANDALRATYEMMLKVGNLRFCVKPNRMPSIDDLIGALVKATDAGARAFRALATIHGRSIAERMSRLDDEELRLLRDLAEKLRTGSSPGSTYDQ